MARPSEGREVQRRRQGGEPWVQVGEWELFGGRPERYGGSYYERPPHQYRSPYDVFEGRYGAPYPGMRADQSRPGLFAWLGDRIADAAERLAARLRGGGERMSEALRGGGEILAGALREGAERLGAGLHERGEQVGEQLRRRDRGPRGYRRPDDRVLEVVCERIAATPLDASDVEVQVNDGAVTLTGRVSSKWERRFLEDLAEDVFGVTEVRNALRVSQYPKEPAGTGASRSTVESRLRCEALMKRDPICCQESDSIQAVASRMRSANVGFMPICGADGRPVGTITDRDLAVRALAEGKAPQAPVSEVMTREVISCAPTDDLRDAEQRMRDHHKSRIMVCDGTGKLVGVISLSDILEREESGRAAETAREIAQREAHS